MHWDFLCTHLGFWWNTKHIHIDVTTKKRAIKMFHVCFARSLPSGWPCIFFVPIGCQSSFGPCTTCSPWDLDVPFIHLAFLICWCGLVAWLAGHGCYPHRVFISSPQRPRASLSMSVPYQSWSKLMIDTDQLVIRFIHQSEWWLVIHKRHSYHVPTACSRFPAYRGRYFNSYGQGTRLETRKEEWL